MSECATEDPTITVTLSWGEDPEDSLALTDECPDTGEGLWWNTLALPDWGMRYTNAPPSAWVPGNILLAAVPDASALIMTVAALGADTAAREAQKAILTAALAHWDLTVTITVGAVVIETWAAQPTIPRWGAVTPTGEGLYVAEAAVLIPVNPTGAP